MFDLAVKQKFREVMIHRDNRRVRLVCEVRIVEKKWVPNRCPNVYIGMYNIFLHSKAIVPYEALIQCCTEMYRGRLLPAEVLFDMHHRNPDGCINYISK